MCKSKDNSVPSDLLAKGSIYRLMKQVFESAFGDNVPRRWIYDRNLELLYPGTPFESLLNTFASFS